MAKQPCRAQTKQGAQCRAFARPGAEFCLSHDPAMVERARAARSRGGKVKAIRGRYRRLDSPAELVKFLAVIMQDVLSARVGPDVGRVVGYLVATQRQLLETGDLAQRVEQLEATMPQPGGRTLGRAGMR